MPFEQVGKANREIVAEGVERLRKVYEEFIHEKQDAGYDFKFVDGQMIGHNFYKLILTHMAQESGVDRSVLVRIAIDTLRKYAVAPITNESDLDLN